MSKSSVLMPVLTVSTSVMLALAQEGQDGELPNLDIREWFSNPIVFCGTLIVLTNWLRKVIPLIEGSTMIFVTSLGLGVSLGSMGQLFGLLTVEPFSSLGFPIGGISYGIVGALTNFLGVNLFDSLSGRKARVENKSTHKANDDDNDRNGVDTLNDINN